MPRLQWAIFVGGRVVDLDAQLGGVAADDLGQLVDAVELEVLADLEAVAKRGREQAAAGGRADQRERPQLHVDRAGAGPFAERDVDAKILHRRVHELLDRLGQAVDLVDEQDRALLGVGEIGEQVLGRGEGGAAGDLQRDAQVARDAGGEGRLAEAGRAVEQDVAERLLAFAGGVDGDLQPLGHLALADHLAHVLRAEGDFVVAELGERFARGGLARVAAARGGFRRRGFVRGAWRAKSVAVNSCTPVVANYTSSAGLANTSEQRGSLREQTSVVKPQ